MDRIVVLLSTYNGEKYLEEQLQSIIIQENVEVELVVRDDGSTDNSIEIVKKYTDLYTTGKNIGYTNSYIKLISEAPNAEYYALADQDDIWFPEKLSAAIEFIKHSDNTRPILYACGRLELEDGNVHKPKITRKYKNKGFSGFLNGYHMQACSMVFNRQLKKIIEQYTPRGLTCAHGTWLQQVCKVNNGIILIDEIPHFIYRIGENNTLGIPKHRILTKIRQLFSKNKEPFSDVICSNLLVGYQAQMSPEDIKICLAVANYRKKKLRVLLNRKYYRGNFSQNILLFLQICAGIA